VGFVVMSSLVHLDGSERGSVAFRQIGVDSKCKRKREREREWADEMQGKQVMMLRVIASVIGCKLSLDKNPNKKNTIERVNCIGGSKIVRGKD
jgi:hypothetical protein